MIIVVIMIIILILLIIIISRGNTVIYRIPFFAVALRFKDYIFLASGHRVENCSSWYSFLNDDRDDAIFIVNLPMLSFP